MSTSPSLPLAWHIRQGVWSTWLCLRQIINRTREVRAPPFSGLDGKVQIVTLKNKHGDDIPLPEIPTFAELPKDERELSVLAARFISLNLNKVFRAMQPGLPSMNVDGREALDQVLSKNYQTVFRDVKLPRVFADTSSTDPADLGRLAVEGPYSLFVERDNNRRIVWDFSHFSDVEHHAHVHSLSLVVVFEESVEQTSGKCILKPVAIESTALGTVKPGDVGWTLGTKLAVCAATTATALTRHFHYVHLICASQWAIAARNELPSDHPLFRLMWPFNMYALYTNFGITEVQMAPDGDFVNVFSLTHKGLIQLYAKMHGKYDISITDPEEDWKRRGLDDTKFEHPSRENFLELFNIHLRFATSYIEAYYATDSELFADTQALRWLKAVDTLIPNGISSMVNPEKPTRALLGRLLAATMVEGNTVHDLIGTTLWDYQLWADHNPTRVPKDGSNIAVDVRHRTVMNNFALQLVRTPMLQNHGKAALDDKGRELFTNYYEDCQQLQQKYNGSPTEDVWRMEPQNLEISMNG